MIRAHQPGSQPIDIPEAIPNPAVPRTVPTPSPAPKEPVKVPAPRSPERVLGASRSFGTTARSDARVTAAAVP